MPDAEFLGLQLSTLGFSTSDNFSFSSQIFVGSSGGYAQAFDQFGIFVGSSSTKVFRAGATFTNARNAYAANTNGTVDSEQVFSTSLAPQLDDTFVLTVARTAGVYSVNYNNLTNSARSGALAINQPAFLNGDPNLYVGGFIMNSGNNTPKALRLDNFGAEVAGTSSVPEPATFGASGLALVGMWRVFPSLRRISAVAPKPDISGGWQSMRIEWEGLRSSDQTHFTQQAQGDRWLIRLPSAGVGFGGSSELPASASNPRAARTGFSSWAMWPASRKSERSRDRNGETRQSQSLVDPSPMFCAAGGHPRRGPNVSMRIRMVTPPPIG